MFWKNEERFLCLRFSVTHFRNSKLKVLYKYVNMLFTDISSFKNLKTLILPIKPFKTLILLIKPF